MKAEKQKDGSYTVDFGGGKLHSGIFLPAGNDTPEAAIALLVEPQKGPSEEDLALMEKARERGDALAYLAETDWMTTRAADKVLMHIAAGGDIAEVREDIPTEVLERRALARTAANG